MAHTLWIAQLRISQATAAKIRARHHLEPNEIRDAVVCREGLLYSWNTHPERGRRAIVPVLIRQKVTFVVVYPQGDDVYALGSAYPK